MYYTQHLKRKKERQFHQPFFPFVIPVTYGRTFSYNDNADIFMNPNYVADKYTEFVTQNMKIPNPKSYGC